MKRSEALFAARIPAVFFWLLACTALLLATSANAGPQYQVVNVAADDVLNVRAEPTPKAEKVGTLDPGSELPVGTGRSAAYNGQPWLEITTRTFTGWVNARYLRDITRGEPASNEEALFHEPLNCHGTEPFWGLTIEGHSGELDSLADGKWSIAFDTQRRTSSMIPAWAIEGKTAEGAPVIVIVEQAEMCSDGMSDISYLYSVYVHMRGGPFLNGCCNAPPGTPAP